MYLYIDNGHAGIGGCNVINGVNEQTALDGDESLDNEQKTPLDPGQGTSSRIHTSPALAVCWLHLNWSCHLEPENTWDKCFLPRPLAFFVPYFLEDMAQILVL